MSSLRRAWTALRGYLLEVGLGIYHIPYLHGVLATILQTARGFFRNDSHILAAAIAFYAILSLIPFVLLLFSLSGYVIESLVQQSAGQEKLFLELAEYVRAVVPFMTDDIVQRLQSITLNREALGLTGLGTLVMTSWAVFRTLEMAFNRIFCSERRRSMLVSHGLFLLFLLGVLLLFLLSHLAGVLGPLGAARSETVAGLLESLLGSSALLRALAGLLVSSLVFVVLVKYFSHERIRLGPAAAGGLMFALLWLLASQAFGYYLRNVARFSMLYGSLASLAVIILWFFYAAVVLLLCCEFTSVLQHRRWREPETPGLSPESASPPAG
ncbi:MAG TPA: YihY/virulence factor BrkB family protein [Myxococcota bacterium]|nr:YihY/virulence factor BrkB family protein [Myxococcota bacterium]HRY94047.1 YihY/virulence factor BrkB family protein [Myxococcota bacterium]HSA21969.1 YihY/virulence factor BrkB family protein [Myxococcota bacterium]